MYKIITNRYGQLAAKGKQGEEAIHLVHCSETIEELKEDSANIYIVSEECTNFARVHLVTDYSEEEALEQVDEYLREKEGREESHLIGALECTI
jgi:hypothetical protein